MSETSAGTGVPTMVETSGATVLEAVAAGLEQLGASREQVEVEVLSAAARPIPGERLTGAGGARVRVRLLDEYSAKARGLLEELLVRMEIPAKVTVRHVPPQARAVEPGREPVILDISGDDLGLLIGWRGENLRALQTVLNLMTGDNAAEGRRLILDVERYRARREDQVRELALRLAHRVKRSGERYTLEPMQAYERRVIHITLEEDDGVRTESAGAEPSRRITIHPTGPARPELAPLAPSLRSGSPGGPPRYGDRERGPFRGDRGPRGGERRPFLSRPR